MKKLKEELLKAAQSWNASGEHNDTEFEGRYFMNDDELDKFAREYKLTSASKIYRDDDEIFSVEKIEKACDCQIIYDPIRDIEAGGGEIIFNN